MRLLGLLLRVVLLAAVLSVVLGIVWRLIVTVTRSASGGGRSASPQPPQRAGGALVRDPHCGTYVMQSRALSSGAGSQAHYFCSDACRTAWLAAHPQ
jgi:hypothetical protein